MAIAEALRVSTGDPTVHRESSILACYPERFTRRNMDRMAYLPPGCRFSTYHCFSAESRFIKR